MLSAARGEYLALCEGDDYWTDPLKLSKQVKYLDRHPETTVCFHPVRVIYEDGAKDSEFPPLSWRRDLSVDACSRGTSSKPTRSCTAVSRATTTSRPTSCR